MSFSFSGRSLLVAAVLTLAPFAVSAQDFTPENPECIAPANPGGGWDFTCRQVGKTMQDLHIIPSTMQVVNLSGGGGGVAFAEVVNKRDDDNDLIVAASSATATRLAQNAYPGNTMDQVRWIGAVGADYGVIAVAADSKINTLPELMDQIKKDPTSIAIGANWRGFYGPGHMSDAAYTYWVDAVAKLYNSDEWKAVMERNGLAPLDLHGEKFQQFVAESVQNITALSKQIGILQ